MTTAGKTVALIVAAGQGERAGGGVPKQYLRVGGKAVLAHAIDVFIRHPAINEVRVVIGRGQEDAYRAAIEGRELPFPIIGGDSRRESVLAGLEAIAGDHVLIHDAARPFLPATVIDRLVHALADVPGAVPVLPVVDTLAKSDGRLGDTVARDGLIRVQTPQAFHREAILAAHRAWPVEKEATDDAQIARAAGLEVLTVTGDRLLEKLTYPEDFAAAETRLARTMIAHTGMGFDVHAFAPGDRLWLGGVEIPHDRTLSGHSDADVALHALTDALLGAICDGDIGSHFPPSDPQWRGAASSRFLEHARDRIVLRGGIIDHVDVTIICEAPRIGPYRDAMRSRIAGLLRVTEGRISIKATTTERLGFTGRSEGIAAQAIATVRLGDEQ
jgi:2-C-methyl-D-erythritol 4-phosphate cytidylyltransferase/2-C-methyl-D-erythritol 2,4-cyclodiphosphate synthase